MTDELTVPSPAELARKALEELYDLEYKREAARTTAVAAMTRYMIFACPEGLGVGDKIVVEFSDGQRACIYEGVYANAPIYNFNVEAEWGVVLRYFTKKGKPCKRTVWIDGTWVFDNYRREPELT